MTDPRAAVSQVGSQVTVLALPLVAIVVLHATTFGVGLLPATVNGAYLLIALPAGVVADRVAKRTLMLASDAGQVLVIGSVPLAYVASVLTLGQPYLVALVSGALEVLYLVSYTSYLPTLVGPEQLMDGNGKLSTTQSMAQIARPGLGALLVGVAGAALALGSDAVSFAVSAACLLAIRCRGPRPDQATSGPRPDRGARGAGRGSAPRSGPTWATCCASRSCAARWPGTARPTSS